MPTSSGLARRLVWLYIEGSLAAVAVTFFLVLVGLEFTLRQWLLLGLGTPVAVAFYVIPDIYLILRHCRPIREVLATLERRERPDATVVSRAVVRALNLPIYSALRVTGFHGPAATLSTMATLNLLNVLAGAGFATWQTLAFAAIVLFFASPTHAIFEYFAVSRLTTPLLEVLWDHCPDLRDEDRRALIPTSLRNKLLYLSIFVTGLPLVFFAVSILFKVNVLADTGATAVPMWVWVAGVSAVCMIGSLVMSILTASEVSRSAAHLAAAMGRVERGDLDVQLKITGTDEYAHLYRGFNLMTAGLREEVRILEMSQRLSTELRLDTLLARIMSTTTDLLGAERSTLFLHDPRTGELWSRIAEGMGTREIRFPADQGIAGEVFASGQVLTVDDPQHDPRFNPEIDRRTGFTTRSILSAAIRNKAGVSIGVTQVLNKRGGPFTAKDEARLRAFTAQIAVALENAQLFAEVLRVKNYSESILRSTSNGLITLDTGGTIVTANDAATAILRLPQEAIVAQPLARVFGARDAWVAQSVTKVAETGRPDVTVDADLALSSGETVSVNLTVTPLIDASGENLGSILAFEDITTEKRVKATMARYMSKEVADELLSHGDAVLGGHDQLVTILFSDIRGFTPLSESMGARETVAMLNEYLAEMVAVITRHGGVIDKYLGDAIMCVFGVPFAGPQDADQAVTVANGMVGALRAFNDRRRAAGKVPVDIGVGISTGLVVVGNIGAPTRMEYTVIGDSVNLASRLEGANKFYGTRILLSEHTVAALKNEARLRPIDVLRVKGKHRPVTVYEALGYQDEAAVPGVGEACQAYTRGVEHYRARRWHEAIACLEQARGLWPADRPSALYLERCRHFLAHPPPDDWDGVWELTEK